MSSIKNHIFIIGSKGIPAKYGGFETFVEQLTKSRQNDDIHYHVSCLAENKEINIYNGARCFNISVPNIGSGKAVLYDVLSLKECYHYIKENNIQNSVIYILACRIGPFLNYYKRRLNEFNTKIYVNPDGHEWKRSKWNFLIRKYWKISESMMVKRADLLICDSKGIETYIHKEYSRFKPLTKFIAYGADTTRSTLSDSHLPFVNWLKEKEIRIRQYYLVVGRFVPENNYELMIREFMKSDTKKDFVIISNVENNSFYKELLEKTGFDKDKRIKFVGTVYDPELLKKIREEAYGYFHGHEVGGTNPSLLEALASTSLNLLLDVVFNREVGENGALYFDKNPNSLATLISNCDDLDSKIIQEYGERAVNRVQTAYSWNSIIQKYEEIFSSENIQSPSNIVTYPTKGVVKV
ncbi:DUF1972 domain-containing protein [Paenibacillus pasadenensis]|uniref:beta 1-4 rhamnosyltransferase Cps2T n=1 Tax=Paenibacillus pasadenensis TaxID=217090 RepID=UPI0020413EA7|nr:DUF1972 domain-containing protein [Paenibacillus pasadenensis]MCM3749151.1 DUF1972 domain-containing protein [Paenibacillus pasadenensis]